MLFEKYAVKVRKWRYLCESKVTYSLPVYVSLFYDLAAKYGHDLMVFMKEKDISPFKSMLVPLAMVSYNLQSILILANPYNFNL
jgi:hypothetical protein